MDLVLRVNDMEFMTIKEVQDTLKISRTTAYDLLHQKDFPSMKINNTYRIPKDSFEEWCKKNMTK